MTSTQAEPAAMIEGLQNCELQDSVARIELPKVHPSDNGRTVIGQGERRLIMIAGMIMKLRQGHPEDIIQRPPQREGSRRRGETSSDTKIQTD